MGPCQARFKVSDYDLGATLHSGQAFRWEASAGAHEGVVAGRWVRLRAGADGIEAETAEPTADWGWLAHYLQVQEDLDAVLAAFPDDPALTKAVRACRGLRLLRQDPWECLASFVLSSNKRISQIRQMVRALCERYGERVPAPAGSRPWHAFPPAARLAACSETELRACRLGFRARYLRGVAARVAAGELELERLGELPLAEARCRLMALPGVGPKIADCVLLFAGGLALAFPLDVWVIKALRRLYFPGENVPWARLRAFAEGHFGPRAGYAQQYLFHYMRTHDGAVPDQGRSPEAARRGRPGRAGPGRLPARARLEAAR